MTEPRFVPLTGYEEHLPPLLPQRVDATASLLWTPGACEDRYPEYR